MRLPLFPLSTVVLPDGLLPLRLFERRYIDMVKDCFKNDTGFGVCLIQEGKESGPVAKPYPMGTRVAIVDFDQGSDGLLHITAKGIEEFNVLTYSTNRFEETHLDDADWVIHRLLEILPLEHDAKFELLRMSSNRERLVALGSLQIEVAER